MQRRTVADDVTLNRLCWQTHHAAAAVMAVVGERRIRGTASPHVVGHSRVGHSVGGHGPPLTAHVTGVGHHRLARPAVPRALPTHTHAVYRTYVTGDQ